MTFEPPCAVTVAPVVEPMLVLPPAVSVAPLNVTFVLKLPPNGRKGGLGEPATLSVAPDSNQPPGPLKLKLIALAEPVSVLIAPLLALVKLTLVVASGGLAAGFCPVEKFCQFPAVPRSVPIFPVQP